MTVVVQCPIRGSQIFTFLPFQNPTWIISAFQLQEYISLLMRLDVNSVVSSPERKGRRVIKILGKAEPTVDEACWIYDSDQIEVSVLYSTFF